MQNITQFVSDKDEKSSGRQGQTSLEVRFEFYAEHSSDDPNQESNGHGDLFSAVEDAINLHKRTGRPTQVRISLEIDGEGRYIEQCCSTPMGLAAIRSTMDL